MAKKEKKADDSVLVEAAKAIGRTAGKVASMVGVTAKPAKKGKLPKTDKRRLPRREKKAKLKLAAKKSA